jgi:hypothetical protein
MFLQRGLRETHGRFCFLVLVDIEGTEFEGLRIVSYGVRPSCASGSRTWMNVNMTIKSVKQSIARTWATWIPASMSMSIKYEHY